MVIKPFSFVKKYRYAMGIEYQEFQILSGINGAESEFSDAKLVLTE
jgi:hypothetical protein